MDSDASCLWPSWLGAAVRPEVDRAIADLYARLDADIAHRGPTCWTSGNCCAFDTFGHRLYVTALEIARFLHHAPQPGHTPTVGHAEQANRTITALPVIDPASAPQQARCVYQVDNRCSVHAIRPMGCRIYFCQQGTQGWQQALYEQYLAEMKTMHERFDVPYAYVEWRAGLSEATAAVDRACG